MSDLDDIFEQYRDADALRNVPFRPDQFSQLQTDLDGEQYGMVGEIAVPVGREPSPAPASAAPAPQAEENNGFEIGGVPIGDIETALNALPAGIARSVSKFIGNTGAAFGLVDQAKVDRFFGAADRITTDVQQGNLPAQILGGAGNIVGQFVAPAGVGIKLLKAAGASPFVATLVSDSLVGLLGMSPNDEALANMISEDASHPAAVALRDLMATDPDDPEWVNRSRNAAEAFALLGMSEAVARSLPEIVRQTKQFVRTGLGQGLERLSAAGRAADERIAELSRGGTMMANPIGAATDVVVSGVGNLARTVSPSLRAFSRAENAALREAASDAAQAKAFKQRAAEIKANYPTDEGWLPIEATGASTGKKGEVKVVWRQPAYSYDKPSRGVTPEQHLETMVNTTVDDVNAVVDRARAGDAKAQEIIRQARWYRDMRTRLRAEFGGLGDIFADLLGATSAQTGVEQNWRNSIEILRRFTRGEYDNEIKLYSDRLDAGESVSPTLLQQLDKAGEFDLIKSSAGALFNTNSPAATAALLGMFRQVRAGSAPKTINFTGNLIGYSSDATIDVWAARYLREIAGLRRIPPPAEKAVGGRHLTGSTLETPKVSGEFKFGQNVFAAAARDVNQSNIIKDYDPSLGDLGADDLQALVWFLQKEKWSANGWTTKAGEGGSLDFEASLAGAADPDAVLTYRRTATETFKPPKQRKRETPEQYDARVEQARATFDEQRLVAEQSLADAAAPLNRTLLGVARARPDKVPSNVEQAELASDLTRSINDDASVVAYQVNNTYGEFMGELERALNAEFVVRSDFNPTTLTQNLVEAGKKYDQDAVFVSKVLRAPTEQSRPGVEIYFSRREGVDMAQKITAMLREKGVDGFTFVTDARQMDRVDVQAAGDAAAAGLTGIRFQYIPEFDDAYDAARHAEIVAGKEDLFYDIMNDILSVEGVAQADVVHYDTKVFRRATGTDWMKGGETYDDFLGAAPGQGDRKARRGQPRGRGTTPPDSSP
jgi:hypothetical protein